MKYLLQAFSLPSIVIKKCAKMRLWLFLLGMVFASALVLLGILIGSYWHFASRTIEKAVLEGVFGELEEDSYTPQIRNATKRDMLLNPELFPQEKIKDTDHGFSLKEASSAIVSLSCPHYDYLGSQASGIIIDKQGLILTNRHAIGSMEEYYCTVGFTNAISEEPIHIYYADTEGEIASENDSEIDLVVLRIVDTEEGFDMPKEFPSIPVDFWGSSDDLQLGESLRVVGYPYIGKETISVTEGIMSGREGYDWIKTSALIGAGSSGSAVFNDEGQLVGIISLQVGDGMAYAIGTDAIKEWLRYSKNR